MSPTPPVDRESSVPVTELIPWLASDPDVALCAFAVTAIFGFTSRHWQLAAVSFAAAVLCWAPLLDTRLREAS